MVAQWRGTGEWGKLHAEKAANLLVATDRAVELPRFTDAPADVMVACHALQRHSPNVLLGLSVLFIEGVLLPESGERYYSLPENNMHQLYTVVWVVTGEVKVRMRGEQDDQFLMQGEVCVMDTGALPTTKGCDTAEKHYVYAVEGTATAVVFYFISWDEDEEDLPLTQDVPLTQEDGAVPREGFCSCTEDAPCGSRCENRAMDLECDNGVNCRLGWRCMNREMQQGASARLEECDAGAAGMGMRTVNDLLPDSFVVELHGQFLKPQVAKKLM